MFVVCPVVLVVVVVERPSRSVSRDELVAAVVLTVSGGSFSFSFITFLDENSTIRKLLALPVCVSEAAKSTS